jgi:hypothetical protein
MVTGSRAAVVGGAAVTGTLLAIYEEPTATFTGTTATTVYILGCQARIRLALPRRVTPSLNAPRSRSRARHTGRRDHDAGKSGPAAFNRREQRGSGHRRQHQCPCSPELESAPLRALAPGRPTGGCPSVQSSLGRDPPPPTRRCETEHGTGQQQGQIQQRLYPDASRGVLEGEIDVAAGVRSP